MGLCGIFGLAAHRSTIPLAKQALLSGGQNILAAFHNKSIKDVVTYSCGSFSGLWVAGFLAITGAPFVFISELMILKAALASGHWIAALGYQRHWASPLRPVNPQWIPVVLTCGVLILGLWFPMHWRFFVQAAADLMEVRGCFLYPFYL